MKGGRTGRGEDRLLKMELRGSLEPEISVSVEKTWKRRLGKDSGKANKPQSTHAFNAKTKLYKRVLKVVNKIKNNRRRGAFASRVAWPLVSQKISPTYACSSGRPSPRVDAPRLRLYTVTVHQSPAPRQPCRLATRVWFIKGRTSARRKGKRKQKGKRKKRAGH